ncbi:MAG: lysophospholipid acyltransferase family protein [Candidatus Acidiferrales bacterium]
MIRSIATYIFAAFGLVLVMPPMIVWTMITGDVVPMYRIFLAGVRVALSIAGIHVRTEGLENVPAATCVFASNHCSNLDPLALVPKIPQRVALLAKTDVFKIPILSKAIRQGGLIPVDRSNKDAAAESVDKAVESLKQGLSFCIFAEGTRSRDGRLQPFKRGAFVMAIRAGVPVVPVSLAGTQNLLRKGDWKMYPGEVAVKFGRPIEASQFGFDQRQQLVDQAHAAVAAKLPPEQQPGPENSGL